jgi:hypothetical protein
MQVKKIYLQRTDRREERGDKKATERGRQAGQTAARMGANGVNKRKEGERTPHQPPATHREIQTHKQGSTTEQKNVTRGESPKARAATEETKPRERRRTADSQQKSKQM